MSQVQRADRPPRPKQNSVRLLRRTASGERFNQHAMTAAHRTLPFGTRVRVMRKGNSRSASVLNDLF